MMKHALRWCLIMILAANHSLAVRICHTYIIDAHCTDCFCLKIFLCYSLCVIFNIMTIKKSQVDSPTMASYGFNKSGTHHYILTISILMLYQMPKNKQLHQYHFYKHSIKTQVYLLTYLLPYRTVKLTR